MSLPQPAPGVQNFTQPILPPTDEPAEYNTNYILYWNSVALDLNRLAVSVASAPNNDPPSASRALAIVHIAINDAYFAIHPNNPVNGSTYLTTDNPDPTFRLPIVPAGADARLAVAGAAITVLRQLYNTPRATTPNATTIILRQFIDSAVAGFPKLDVLSPSYTFGVAVGRGILNFLDQGAAPFEQGGYRPPEGQYGFDDDPTNPIRIVPVDINNPNGPKKAVKVYSSPFYGFQGKRIAVQGLDHGNPTEHILADPPVGFGVNNVSEYDFAFEEVYRQGGAQNLNTTSRRPDQTVSAFFWAYDGANLLGTPLRHYNLILRKLVVEKRKVQDLTHETNNAEFARLFALVNAAMGDAGIYAWLEKYTYQFWRPLSGVREDSTNPLKDPFWLTQGAPDTNTNDIPFKVSHEHLPSLSSPTAALTPLPLQPPFPSYPSGHATFGGACFQTIRLYYKARDSLPFADDSPDSISFTSTSEELNGISRDLRQPYDPSLPITSQLGTVRTRVPKTFSSLWEAIFDNAISRVYLGVHWGFDAFASSDVVAEMRVQEDGTVRYLNSEDVRYRAMGPRKDRPGQLFPVGGVPLGIGIANDIFESGLRPAAERLQPGNAVLVPAVPGAAVAAAVTKAKVNGNGIANGNTGVANGHRDEL